MESMIQAYHEWEDCPAELLAGISEFIGFNQNQIFKYDVDYKPLMIGALPGISTVKLLSGRFSVDVRSKRIVSHGKDIDEDDDTITLTFDGEMILEVSPNADRTYMIVSIITVSQDADVIVAMHGFHIVMMMIIDGKMVAKIRDQISEMFRPEVAGAAIYQESFALVYIEYGKSRHPESSVIIAPNGKRFLTRHIIRYAGKYTPLASMQEHISEMLAAAVEPCGQLPADDEITWLGGVPPHMNEIDHIWSDEQAFLGPPE
jgi:hypothetical protein